MTMGSNNSLFARILENMWLQYAFAVLSTFVVLLTCHASSLFLSSPVPYILLFLVVACSAWYCGLGPATLALTLALAGAKYWFISPTRSFRFPDTAQSITMLVFLVASVGVIAMAEARRRHNENLRCGHAQLEDRVKERTAELDIANKNLRDLSARLLQLQDDERRRIARELHDSVGQLLAALTMNLAGVRADIDRLRKTATVLADSEALVQEMSQEVRTISHLLHPPLLDEAGLASAVRWYADGFAQRSKITVNLEVPADLQRLDRESETAIFRTVQECLTNIHRHSESPTARICVATSDGQICVEIEDRGNGIPPEKQFEMTSTGTPGVGLRGMRERLRQLGGSLDIHSNGKGTLIVARLPVTVASASPVVV